MSGFLTGNITNVQASQISNDAIDSQHYVDGSIDTAHIANAAITTEKISASFASDKDIRALALEMADVKGVALNFANGQADPFDSDTMGTKAGATTLYDATNDYYHNPDFEALVSDDSTTWGSQAHILGGGATTGLNPEAVDLANSNNSWWYAIDFGSGNEMDIIKGTATWSGGYNGNVGGAWEYSDNNSSWTSVNTITGGQTTPMVDTWSSAGAHRYWRLRIDSWDGSAVIAVNQVRLERTPVSTANMTLTSSALTAASAPSNGFITVQADPVDSITINTDLKAEISRDGGSNWTTVTLVAGATNSNFINYEGSADISGQPSGTSMKYRVTTLNTKEIRVSGVVLRWT
tara:strand:+ start:212 stop:1258 length:1047 start_codon:yes stop_codon:yes gene_type:complete